MPRHQPFSFDVADLVQAPTVPAIFTRKTRKLEHSLQNYCRHISAMEKFSAFRDPSTGLAPFAIPVPASTSFAPALYALYPLLGALAAVRMLALCALLLLCWLLSCLFLPLVSLRLCAAAPDHQPPLCHICQNG